MRERLIEPAGIIVDAKSGVTGAGKQSGEAFSFAEYADDSHAYKLLAHQHTPEIARALSRLASGIKLTFTAHYLPDQARAPRHVLRPAAARARAPRASPSASRTRTGAPGSCARWRPTRSASSASWAPTRATSAPRPDDDVVIAVGAIDNLLKGAAGQAVQNLNLMNGWDETTGLDGLQRVSP